MTVAETHLGHVDGADGQRLEAEDRPVLVLLPALQHHVQLIALALQKVRVLKEGTIRACAVERDMRIITEQGGRFAFVSAARVMLRIKDGIDHSCQDVLNSSTAVAVTSGTEADWRSARNMAFLPAGGRLASFSDTQKRNKCGPLPL